MGFFDRSGSVAVKCLCLFDPGRDAGWQSICFSFQERVMNENTQQIPASTMDGPGIALDSASGLASAEIIVTAAPGANLSSERTILLVEDESFVRNAMREALESAGYEVFVASNATEALKIQEVEPGAIDLLLTDVVIAPISGHELVRKFLALYPRTAVLLVSGYQEHIVHCEDWTKGIKYLAKPFSIPTLLQNVQEALNTRNGLSLFETPVAEGCSEAEATINTPRAS
jgi:CheY-like chemotaxis protein